MSAVLFENYLGQIKHILRKHHLPLQQAVERLSETPNAELPKLHKCDLSPLNFDGPVPHHLSHGEEFRKVVTEKYTLSVVQGVNCVQIVGDISTVW